jgi:hypothetical protein
MERIGRVWKPEDKAPISAKERLAKIEETFKRTDANLKRRGELVEQVLSVAEGPVGMRIPSLLLLP